MSSKNRVLVVADRTVDPAELIATLRSHRAASFTLLVPAVLTAADAECGWLEAIDRAEAVADGIRRSGLDLDETIVGDSDPFAAVGDALHSRRFDEVVFTVDGRVRRSLPRLGETLAAA